MTKDDAIAFFGSQTALAEAVGLTRQAVNQWPEEVPPLRQIQLERLTRRKLKAADDIFERG
jgi:DNA-binding transcriptional regulator YdaS (Cro superfamily)